MAIPHQNAADQYIMVLRTQYTSDEVDYVVGEAERLAEQAGSPELTRGHLVSVVSHYSATRQKPSEPAEE